MADLIQWDSFETPGGMADNSWVGPVAGAYSDAAKLAANPITRVFERMAEQRFAEQQAQADFRFRAAQAGRDREDMLMRKRESDAAALARLDQEYNRREEIEIAKQRQADIAALAMRDASGLGSG